MKKQRNTFKISALILLFIILMLGIVVSVSWLFSAQYNSKGVSHYLVITIDENQPKEYVGELNNHKIYVEKLDLDATNFRTVDAKNISIKEAINKKVVSIKDWKKYARKIRKDGDAEILQFENYEIACVYDDCIIRPLSK